MSVPDFVKILRVKRYSENTIVTYASFLKKTEAHFNRSIETLTETDLFPFVHEQIHTKGVSRSTQKQLIGAIKLYFKEVLDQEINLQMMLPHKGDFVLPEVLSQQEVIRVLQCPSNVKHKAILALLYSSGLRIGEVINLRIKDIDSGRMTTTCKLWQSSTVLRVIFVIPGIPLYASDGLEPSDAYNYLMPVLPHQQFGCQVGLRPPLLLLNQ